MVCGVAPSAFLGSAGRGFTPSVLHRVASTCGQHSQDRTLRSVDWLRTLFTMSEVRSFIATAAQESDVPVTDSVVAIVAKFCEDEELSVSDLGVFVRMGELVDRWACRLPFEKWANDTGVEVSYLVQFITALANSARSDLECGVDSLVRAVSKRPREQSTPPAASRPMRRPQFAWTSAAPRCIGPSIGRTERTAADKLERRVVALAIAQDKGKVDQSTAPLPNMFAKAKLLHKHLDVLKSTQTGIS